MRGTHKVQSIIGGFFFGCIGLILLGIFAYEIAGMTNNANPYISVTKRKTTVDDLEEISFDQVGNYIILMNKEYNEEMKKYVKIKYTTSFYEYIVNEGEEEGFYA